MPTVGDHTQPPCLSCHAHNDLENEFQKMRAKNFTEHATINANLKWIMIIGVTLVGLMGFILREHLASSKFIATISNNVTHVVEAIKDNKSDIKDCKNKFYKRITQ